MKINKFEDILVWQKAQDLGVEVYQIFGQSKDYGFRDQICRAAISISNNIAEGFDRQTDKQFVSFLYYALGSTAELRSMLYIAVKIKLLDEERKNVLISKTQEVSRMISGFIKAIT